MKKVAIFTRITEYNNKDILYIPKALYDVLSQKVEVILIPFDVSDDLNEKIDILNIIDGVILPGGDDIYNFELKLLKYLYEKDIPTLGICLGMQTMAVYFDGKMGHLKDLSHKSKNKYVHEITIKPDSLLYEIVGKDKIMVNSRHQDYIINTDMYVGAMSGNLIEEVEDRKKRFFMGVQWHPENLDDDNSKRIFDYFIKKL